MWFGHKSSEAVKEILDEEDFNLAELMDQETAVKDLRSEGEVFAKRLKEKPEIFYKFIDYIIKIKEFNERNDDTIKESYKFPFIASEIFTIEIPELIDAFFDENSEQKCEKFPLGIPLLSYFMNFLRKENKINETSAGYFQKGVNAILNKRGSDFLKFFFQEKMILDSFIERLPFKAIMEISIRILFIDFIPIDLRSNMFVNERKSFLYGIIENFKRTSSLEAKENIILCFHKIFTENLEGNYDIGLLDIFLSKERIFDFLELIKFSKNGENILLYLKYLKIALEQFDNFMNPTIPDENLLGANMNQNFNCKSPISKPRISIDKIVNFSQKSPVHKKHFYGYEKSDITKISLKIIDSLIPILFHKEIEIEGNNERRRCGEIKLIIMELIKMTIRITNGSKECCKVFQDNEFLKNIQNLMVDFNRHNLFLIILVNLIKELLKHEGLCAQVDIFVIKDLN